MGSMSASVAHTRESPRGIEARHQHPLGNGAQELGAKRNSRSRRGHGIGAPAGAGAYSGQEAMAYSIIWSGAPALRGQVHELARPES
jgi:hypothetical protein